MTTTTTYSARRIDTGAADTDIRPYGVYGASPGREWLDGAFASLDEATVEAARRTAASAPARVPKTRTITLTDRPPVKISEDEWPIIATGSADADDSDGRGNQPNREWTRTLRVRQHKDGRAIVYGVYGYSTKFQGANGAAAKRGALLAAPATPDQIIAAIRVIGDELAEAESDAPIEDSRKDSRQWRVAVQTCIADLPAVEL